MSGIRAAARSRFAGRRACVKWLVRAIVPGESTADTEKKTTRIAGPPQNEQELSHTAAAAAAKAVSAALPIEMR